LRHLKIELNNWTNTVAYSRFFTILIVIIRKKNIDLSIVVLSQAAFTASTATT